MKGVNHPPEKDIPVEHPMMHRTRALAYRDSRKRKVLRLASEHLQVGQRTGHASVLHSHHPSGAASSRDGSCVRGLRKRLAPDGTLDNYFRALAMAPDGVGQTVSLADGQVPRPEGRHHPLIRSDGPAVLLFDNFKCDHGASTPMGCKKFQNSLHHSAPDGRNHKS